MNETKLYSNSNIRKDFFRSAFGSHNTPPCTVFIAAAFFTDTDAIKSCIENGCAVQLVVRLGFPTSGQALAECLKLRGVKIRYFTDSAFHPKLYIFGVKLAIVGSANLTGAALISNQEIMVEIPASDPRLTELASIFSEYWLSAKVLTPEIAEAYIKICKQHEGVWKEENKLEKKIQSSFGLVVAGNIVRDKHKETSANLFIEDFRKGYQEWLEAFSEIQEIYGQSSKRKTHSSLIPMRVEIDSFISFIRERHAYGDSWSETPLAARVDRAGRISELVAEWHRTPWPYFEQNIVETNYPRLLKVFGTKDAIKSASDNDLFDALTTVHSFNERLRYFAGGLPTLKAAFFESNKSEDVKESLTYLLYGDGAVEERMANLIFNPAYSLNNFGRSSVQELIGWINDDNLPVINGRTTKVMRFLGFEIPQV
jgi:hypothetical protein